MGTSVVRTNVSVPEMVILFMTQSSTATIIHSTSCPYPVSVITVVEFHNEAGEFSKLLIVHPVDFK